MNRGMIFGIVAMAVIVIASNILVNYLFGNWMTYGTFTYPFAFLVTDLMNRIYGVAAARRVVWAGFIVGIGCSFIGTQIMGEFGPLVTLRVAIGSGTAFLVAQLLDVSVFDRLRNGRWWHAPLASTLVGSSVDTILFFTIAFAASLSFINPSNDVSWAQEAIPLLGFGPVVPLWVSLMAADYLVKLWIGLIALLPFRILAGRALGRVE